MISIPLAHFIPVGALVVKLADSNIPPELWPLTYLKQWHHLVLETPEADEELDRGQRLPPDIERLLLSSHSVAPYGNLLRHQWVRFEFAVALDDPHQAICRVYLLPDDIDRSVVERSDPSRRAARLRLLAQLDFSPSTWHGEAGISRSPSPLLFDSSKADNDLSLLQMFNSMPSPDPRPQSIEDPVVQELAYRLVDSNIVGLNTTLYPYQRRSAALMLRKEYQPEKVLDPRLVKAIDQHGATWYYDAVEGFGLRESRQYDGVRGGVLAEEMGSGKTLICLSLILATKHLSSAVPELYRGGNETRAKIGSLADMAAACATRNAVPWKLWFGDEGDAVGYDKCKEAIRRNPGYYLLPRPVSKRHSRIPAMQLPPWKIYLSHTTLVVVPPNLVQQWKQEISKHTSGLSAVFITRKDHKIPSVEDLLGLDIILFSTSRFERLLIDGTADQDSRYPLGLSLAGVQFKRCIVDEGHRLGNSTSGNKSNLHLVLDTLQISARWSVTGTPAKGLFGVSPSSSMPSSPAEEPRPAGQRSVDASAEQEKDDLKRIGSLATLYLKARPWANTIQETGDKTADWSVYVMQPKHSSRSTGRKDCLRATLESLIIRHPTSETSRLLPTVKEEVIYLDGSYQDKLSLNLFFMMIIFNAVQSQRTDQDYFFHPRQRKALLALMSNLRQASFFGASFLSPSDITRSVETAEKFLAERKVPITQEDEALLRSAITFGQLAADNSLKTNANIFHDIPLYVKKFPGNSGKAWSLDDQEGDPVCMASGMVQALQRYLQPAINATQTLQLLLTSTAFQQRGWEERTKAIEAQLPTGRTSGNGASERTLAGNTQLGHDRNKLRRRHSLSLSTDRDVENITPAQQLLDTEIAQPLAETQIISTASAKLSYLIDQVVKYQQDEQIIIFYENDNVAYYLSGILDMLQIQHLIYAKTGLTTERRAIYVATFNHSSVFRVMLMDISQAAFGLDMRTASRIYFINPVLNPQVEAQAIGRARRISQQKPVSVETLVLRGSLEEVIVQRRREMTQAEQRRCSRSILDDKPIYEWMLNASIIPLQDILAEDGPSQTAMLRDPQFVFGRGFGRTVEHPDAGLVALPDSPERISRKTFRVTLSEPDDGLTRAADKSTPATTTAAEHISSAASAAVKEPNIMDQIIAREEGLVVSDTSRIRKRAPDGDDDDEHDNGCRSPAARPARRVRFADADAEEE